MVPKDNAMNLIHGLQRNQTKLCYEELAHHCSELPYVNYRQSFFGHVMRKKKLKHLVTTRLILKEKAAGERSEKR